MEHLGDEYKGDMMNSLILMTLVSWISFLQYLRFFEDERILIAYILASVKAMIPFMAIIVIMLTAFTLTYFQVMRDSFLDEDLEHVAVSPLIIFTLFLEQYKLMYGDFGGLETNTAFDYGLLIIATILVPLLMLNLLIAIISEAYAELAENKIRQDNAQLCSIILELEAFMFWNRKETTMEHLVVAENVIPTMSQSEGQTRGVVKQLSKVLDDKNIPTIEQIDKKFDEKMDNFKD
jgi:hypothetical protein